MSNCKHFPDADDHCFVCQCDEEEASREADRIANEATVSQAHLDVDDDSGYVTIVRSLWGPSLLGIRRKVRELRWHREIHSPYDCTGICFHQGCKLLKVYRAYAGQYVAIVEITRSYDV